MRRNLRATITGTALAVVILALSGASLPVAASAAQPREITPSYAAVPYHQEAPALSDPQLVAAAAPERVALATQAKAHAAALAAAAAAARRASIARTSIGARYQSSGGGRTINVWTSGFQAQVNACRGGVDLTAAYHTRTVGEHWSCGGASFPETPGSIVRFTGLDAGTYKVIGLVATLDAYTAHTSNIPRGYQMLFQTCRGGNSHYTIFIALERIG
jgi:hypothetical protein